MKIVHYYFLFNRYGMINEFVKYYQDASSVLQSFVKTLDKKQFKEVEEASEVYTLTLIKLLSENASSIAYLLKKKHYVSVVSLIRIIIESFFNFNWVIEGKNSEEINERVYKLEGNSYRLYEDELKKMEDNLTSTKPVWNCEKLEFIRNEFEFEKKKYPHLTKIKDGKVIFKSAPPFANRMGENRIQDHHFYSFTSFFSHPTPKLRDLYLVKMFNTESKVDYLSEQIARVMVECFYFYVAILSHPLKIFSNIDCADYRLKLYKRMEKLALKVSERYKRKFD